MKGKNCSKPSKDDLGYEEEIEEISLSPAESIPDGTLISSFNFSEDSIIDNRKTKTEAAVKTPKVDGEAYTIGRFYKLRYSTAKMLNEIKANHHNVNVYMNTIVDDAIRYYYNALAENNK